MAEIGDGCQSVTSAGARIAAEVINERGKEEGHILNNND